MQPLGTFSLVNSSASKANPKGCACAKVHRGIQMATMALFVYSATWLHKQKHLLGTAMNEPLIIKESAVVPSISRYQWIKDVK